ncbi:MAG: hypothetical protein ABR505_04440 [Actinomycetota bacterium]
MNIHATTAEEITRREGVGSLRLWFGLLGAPLAWVTQLLLNYSLEEWFACSPAATASGEIAGFSVTTVAVGVSVLLTAVALAAAAVSLGCLRRTSGAQGGHVGDRARWMAIAGVMNSVLYTVALLVSFAPPVLLDVCRSSP